MSVDVFFYWKSVKICGLSENMSLRLDGSRYIVVFDKMYRFYMMMKQFFFSLLKNGKTISLILYK